MPDNMFHPNPLIAAGVAIAGIAAVVVSVIPLPKTSPIIMGIILLLCLASTLINIKYIYHSDKKNEETILRVVTICIGVYSIVMITKYIFFM